MGAHGVIGSMAATLQAAYAGIVPAGSAFAVAQSVGAAGLATGTLIGAGIVAGGVAGAAEIGKRFLNSQEDGSYKNKVR